ncbi:MAG: glycosyltransferase, partial [Bacteroidota bacterium]
MICKKRVQLIHYSSQPGGIEVLLPLLIGNLKSYCFNSFVLRPSNEADYNVYKDTPIKISYGTSGLSTYWYLFKYAVKNRKDVFHVFNIGPYALIVLRLAGVRNLIYSIHGTIYWKNRSQHVLRKIIWKLAMSSKYIITSNSVFSGEVFKNKVLPQTNPILLYNPIDPQRFINFGARIEDKTKIKIVYSGRLAHGKN